MPPTYKQYPGMEMLSGYRKDGYHPVDIDDIFLDRYRVVSKLGHGSNSTVWLVEDQALKRLVSLKVLAAYASTASREIDVIRHLMAQQQQIPTAAGAEYIMKVFDEFEIEGPNGIHRCIVTEVLGPPLDFNELEEVFEDDVVPLDIRKKMACQIARGVAYLHKCGIVHGDLYPRNVLLYHPQIAHFSLTDFDDYFEHFDGAPITRHDGVPFTPTAHFPQLAYSRPYAYPLVRLCLSSLESVHVKICDFGEAFLYACQPSTTTPIPRHISPALAAPEILFKDPINPAPPSDIWALAVVIHMLFSEGVNKMPFKSDRAIVKEVIREMVRTLRQLPQRWWTRWAERGEYFDENGILLGDGKGMLPLVKLSSYDKVGEEDMKVLECLLRKMLRYEMEDRISADEVVRLIPTAWSTGTRVFDTVLP